MISFLSKAKNGEAPLHLASQVKIKLDLYNKIKLNSIIIKYFISSE